MLLILSVEEAEHLGFTDPNPNKGQITLICTGNVWHRENITIL